jgi:hypothetical protein
MKFCLQALWLLLVCCCARGQDVAAPSGEDWNVHVEFEVISLPAKKAHAMLPDLRDDAKVADAYTKLKAMVQAGEAKMEANLGGQTMHAGDLKLKQVEEVRYPIEFEQPNPIALEPAAPTAVAPGKDAKLPISVSYPPTTFETRDVGITLSVSFGVSEDGKRLFATAEPEHSWFMRWDEFEVGRLANNEKILWKQPRFAVTKVSSTFGMESGQRVLLSAHPIANQPDQFELFFLRVWTSPRRSTPAR